MDTYDRTQIDGVRLNVEASLYMSTCFTILHCAQSRTAHSPCKVFIQPQTSSLHPVDLTFGSTPRMVCDLVYGCEFDLEGSYSSKKSSQLALMHMHANENPDTGLLHGLRWVKARTRSKAWTRSVLGKGC